MNQNFNGPVDQVTAGDIHNHNPRKKVPEGNPNRRECPQCADTTWLATEKCIHCDYNLFAHDYQMRQEIVAQRKTKMLMFLVAVAVSGMALAPNLPQSFRSWVIGISAVSALFAMGLMK